MSVPQGALQLMLEAQREVQGKPHWYILAKHVPDNLKCRIWANKYVDFQFLVESDPCDEVACQLVPTADKSVIFKLVS